ncbi:ribokinase [Marininema halotolerans]|uniref:Ribokinase n=1 Tax=Marininema halotolerans TaxID=1155944 RepID=A0A1I6PNH2_9BACL|nr:ribokinase [Marininema halotolerans]SFS41585.1 ribokinase [Marininema halotolerans]
MTKAPVSIVVVGSLNMDIVVRAPKQPRMGETIQGDEVHMVPGGKGANQAVASARLGAKTTMIGAIGDDSFGETLQGTLTKEGIDTKVQTFPETSTGVATVLLAEGDNAIVVISGANALLGAKEVEQERALIEAADVLLLQLEIPLESVCLAAKIAKEAGTRVILNPAPAKKLPPELFKHVDLLTPNETELQWLSGCSLDEVGIEAAMKKLLQMGVGSVVATLGARGAAILEPDSPVMYLPSNPVKNVVDTTGAGDAFNAGLACALGEGKSLVEAVDFAGKTSAIAITRLGAQAGMPFRSEVDGRGSQG